MSWEHQTLSIIEIILCAKCNGYVNSLLKKHVSTGNSSFYMYRSIYLRVPEFGGPVALYFLKNKMTTTKQPRGKVSELVQISL